MKTAMKIDGSFVRCAALFLILVGGPAFSPAWATEKPAEEKAQPAEEAAESISLRNYSSLTSLVAMIGHDAMAQLQDFFDVSPVTIEPFVVLDEFTRKQRISMLGATLADQMAAEVSNGSLAVWRPATKGEHEQRVSGLLQEVDGYLRVHITAVNTRGERRAYVVSVEMSEPIYRALHSYVIIP
ncbi:hypothetical protein ACUUL3_14020 [Thiovibrio sp. JS02]